MRANELGIDTNIASSGITEAEASTNVITSLIRRPQQIICKLPCIYPCHVECDCHEQIKNLW